MNALWQTPLPGVLLTALAYWVGLDLQRRVGGHPLINPVAFAIVIVIVFLRLTGISYATYFDSAQGLHWLLAPATVALAVPLARELKALRRLLLPVLGSVLVGSVTGCVSAIALARWTGADSLTLLSLAPKSVTTPIAMGLSEKLGGVPQLTAVCVILTGIIGAVLGPWWLDRLRITDQAARGVAMGTAAHGIGTAAIYQTSTTAGAFSGLAMGLAGLITAVVLAWIVRWFGL